MKFLTVIFGCLIYLLLSLSIADADLLLIKDVDKNILYCTDPTNNAIPDYKWTNNEQDNISSQAVTYWVPKSDHINITCNEHFSTCENWAYKPNDLRERSNGFRYKTHFKAKSNINMKFDYVNPDLVGSIKMTEICPKSTDCDQPFEKTLEKDKGINFLLKTGSWYELEIYSAVSSQWYLLKEVRSAKGGSYVSKLNYIQDLDNVKCIIDYGEGKQDHVEGNFLNIAEKNNPVMKSRIYENAPIITGHDTNFEIKNAQGISEFVRVIEPPIPPTQECRDGSFKNKVGNCQPCGKCRDDANCDKNSGECPYQWNKAYCKLGYRPPICTQECQYNHYGNDCQLQCINCAQWKCDKVKGCLQCVADDLDINEQCKTCSEGFYWAEQARSCVTCGNCYNNQMCNKITGSCPDQKNNQPFCKPGYIPPLCFQECQYNFYGNDCQLQCINCVQGKCDKVKGCTQCIGSNLDITDQCKSCASGFYYDKNTNRCATCGNCYNNQICDRHSGECPKLRNDQPYCKLGYIPPLCLQACLDRFYWDEQKQLCANCGNCYTNQICDKHSGECPYQRNLPYCKPGYNPPLCLQECDNNKYGDDCQLHCFNCANGKCDKVHGCTQCLADVLDIDDQCKSCVTGLYYDNQKQSCVSCGKCNNNQICNRHSGECPKLRNGQPFCKPGYIPPLCLKECEYNYYGDDCKLQCSNCARGKCDKEIGCTHCVRSYLDITDQCNSCASGFYYNKDTNRCATCGNCNNNQKCDKHSGDCPYEWNKPYCQHGYWPKQCLHVCSVNHYGVDCKDRCVNCAPGKCDKVVGCTECLTNFDIETQCKTCVDGFYFNKNTQLCTSCGHCYNGKFCDKNSGNCLQEGQKPSCKTPGFKPPQCLQVCDDNQYGEDCKHQCDNCQPGKCDKVLGCTECLTNFDIKTQCKLCNGGYYKSVSSSPYYYSNIAKSKCESCGKCLNAVQCNAQTGECPSYCENGYEPPFCSECMLGFFKNNLGNCVPCGKCFTGEICDKVTGDCPIDPGRDFEKTNCEPGYKRKKCLEACDDGTYGHDCSQRCENCNRCDRFRGCVDCIGNYKTPLCKECLDGYFGNTCENKCENCLEGHCNKVTGCTSCLKNHTGPLCQDCNDGFYMDKTECKACGNCKYDHCNKENGHCVVGNVENDQSVCIDGFEPPSCHDETSNLTLIIILVILVLILFSGGIITFYFVRKRQFKNIVQSFQNSGNGNINEPNINIPLTENPRRLRVAVPTIELPPSNSSIYESTYDEIGPKRSHVIKDLETYIKQAIEAELFSTQHTALGRTLIHSAEEGKKDNNVGKNRWKKMLPYDRTRVKLNNPSNVSDYINASYIHSYDRKYIATQGPLITTINDFWQMINQENVEIIIMVANLVEGGKSKCDKYWPELETECHYGSILVQNIEEEVFIDHTERLIRLTFNNRQRNIYHFHYTAWPDHGVPRFPQSLAVFLKQIIDKIVVTKRSPIVIHCSAGVGRTGTVILSLAGYFMYEKEHEVDMLAILSEMREQRPYVVDNSSQYELAHKCVLELQALKQYDQPLDTFYPVYRNLKENEGSFDHAFKKLLHMCQRDVVKIRGLPWSNSNKNRFSNIIPDDLNRVKLEGRDNYINAVHVNSLKIKNRYIVTQLPLPNTVNDFWSMIFLNESDVIVLLNTPQPFTEQSTIELWNNSTEIILNDFIIKYKNSVSCDLWDIITLHITGKYMTKIVTLYEYKALRYESETFDNPVHILKLWFEMEQITNKTVVVSCFDGVRLSGLFVAASLLFERIANMKKVDINLAVRTVKRNREQFINSLEQYIFLYEAAMAYLDETETYYSRCMKN